MPVKQRKSNVKKEKVVEVVSAEVERMSKELEIWMTGQMSEAQRSFSNPYIMYGYRQTTECIKTTFMSLFTFHNESMNIWSHLIGCICVIYGGWQVSQEMRASERQSVMETLAFESYIFCAALCLLLSTIYHWFGFMSEQAHECLLRLDVTGIGLLVSGSFFPGVYYGFYCTPDSQVLHFLLTAVVFVVGALAPWVDLTIRGVPVRPFIFASLVLAGLIPFVHWLAITPAVFREEVTKEFLLMFVWYGVGFVLFMTRAPEKLFPKSFFATQVFSSHFLWHVCVLNAVYVWFHFLIQYRELLAEVGCSHHFDPTLSQASVSVSANSSSY
mmetsp:Transcript_7809/g.17035  ORF Transcript_7809/g.17035 Transcript_7809/m.17035 type:complete len:328 (+) Transcript_7809:154-1137(+)